MSNNTTYFFLIFSMIFPLVIHGQITWHETDWTNGKYEYSENIDADASRGELILTNETSNMVFAFAPTPLAGVWDIEEYDEKLFFATCTLPMAVNGGKIYSYDFASNNVQFEYEVWEQGVIQMRVINNKLFIPGLDSQGSWDWGNIYIYESNSWTRKATVPFALHVLDVFNFENQLFVSTETQINENSFAKIYKSTNEGDSWTAVLSVSPGLTNVNNSKIKREQNNQLELMGNRSRRLLFMGTFDNKLYIQSDLRQPEGKVLFCFDGLNWSTVSLENLVFSYGIFRNYNNKLYFLNKNYMHIFDGNNWDSVALPFSGGVIARSLAQFKGHLFSGAENGILYKSQTGYQWTQESILGNGNYEIESIAVFHGRLYVGTNGDQGKVFVSAAAPEGYLVSEKQDFGQPLASGTINWHALTPTINTLVKFQIRTAATEQELSSKQFVGPDNTIQSFYTASGENISSAHAGDLWIQYKAILSTEDNALMPILQDVTISVNSYVTSKNISGNITYHTTNIPVNDVALVLSGNSIASTNSNVSGYFEFSNLEPGKNYSITVSKQNDVPENAISAYDAALIARMAIHIITNPTMHQLIAADVDRNGAVQMYDAAMTARYAVGLSPLPGSLAGEWVFNPSTRSYQSLDNNINDADFIAILLGDVNGNWSLLNNLENEFTTTKKLMLTK